jgi:sulfite exporter TauE/SafE
MGHNGFINKESTMTALADNSSEQLVRFSRRSMAAVLVIVAGTGAMALAMTLWPEGPASRFMETAGWVYPIAIVLLGAALRATLRGKSWDPRSPDAKAVLNDELRQDSLNRSSRAALIAVLVAEVPLALLFGTLAQASATRTALAMAEATITLGMATFIALFLFLDRE